MAQRSAYGGQAVIEGVMIRGMERVATACRLKDGAITVRRDIADTLTKKYAWLRLAFVRGTPALIDSLRLGYRTLMWSADLAMEGEEQKKPTTFQYVFSMTIGLLIGIGIFVLLPTALAHYLLPASTTTSAGSSIWEQLKPTPQAVLPNLAEGLLRVIFLVAYILFIGMNKEIKRVFAYHGAEHKVVNAWEANADLTVEGAKPYSRIHQRCGTSFLFLVFVVGILVHALIGWPDNHLVRFVSRLLLLFPIAGIAYELIRLAGRHQHSALLRVLVWPGMLLQRLTTAEPEDDQIEVALHSLRAVLEDEGVLEPTGAAKESEPPSEHAAIA